MENRSRDFQSFTFLAGDVVLRDEIELVQTVTTVRDVGKRSSSWNDNEVIGDNVRLRFLWPDLPSPAKVMTG